MSIEDFPSAFQAVPGFLAASQTGSGLPLFPATLRPPLPTRGSPTPCTRPRCPLTTRWEQEGVQNIPFQPPSELDGRCLSGVVGDVWAGGGRPGLARRVVTPPLVVGCQPTLPVNTGQGAGGQLRTHQPDLRRDVREAGPK